MCETPKAANWLPLVFGLKLLSPENAPPPAFPLVAHKYFFAECCGTKYQARPLCIVAIQVMGITTFASAPMLW
jgi:hypothetical protein